DEVCASEHGARDGVENSSEPAAFAIGRMRCRFRGGVAMNDSLSFELRAQRNPYALGRSYFLRSPRVGVLLDGVQIRHERLAADALNGVLARICASLAIHPPFKLILEFLTTHLTH